MGGRPKRQTVCRFWLQGKCTKGDACDYLHAFDRSRMPECKYGVECDNPSCEYKHTGRDELCARYREGFCPFGPVCKYGHKPLPAEARPAVALSLTAAPEAADVREKTTLQNMGGRSNMAYDQPAPGTVPRPGEAVVRGGTADGRSDIQGQLLTLVSEFAMHGRERGLPAADAKEPVAFFTVRASSLTALKASVRDGLWVVPEGTAPTLRRGLAAFTGGVFLVFSRLGSKGFQGVARVTGLYGEEPAAADAAAAAAEGAAAAAAPVEEAAGSAAAAAADIAPSAGADGAPSSSSGPDGSVDVKPDVKAAPAAPDGPPAGKTPPAGWRFVTVEWLRMVRLPFAEAAAVRNPMAAMASAARCGDWQQLPVPVGLALLVLVWRKRRLVISVKGCKGEIEPVEQASLDEEDLGRGVAAADEATRREMETGGAGEGGVALLAKMGGPGCHQQRQPPVVGVSGGLLSKDVPAYAVSAVARQTMGQPFFSLAAAWASGPGRHQAPVSGPDGVGPASAASASSSAPAPSTAAAPPAHGLTDDVDVTPFPAEPEPEAGFGFVLGVTRSNAQRALGTGTVFMEDGLIAEGFASIRVGTPVLLLHRDEGTLFGLFVALDKPKELRISGGAGRPAFVRAIVPFGVACKLQPLAPQQQGGLWESSGVPLEQQPAGLPGASAEASALNGVPRSGLVSRRFLANVAVRMQEVTGAPPILAARMAAVLRHMRGLPVAPAPGDPLAPGFPAPEQPKAPKREREGEDTGASPKRKPPAE